VSRAPARGGDELGQIAFTRQPGVSGQQRRRGKRSGQRDVERVDEAKSLAGVPGVRQQVGERMSPDGRTAMRDTVAIARKHASLGLTDGSLVAVAGRMGTDRIATFDQHFRRMTTVDGDPFRLLPADS
jgi:predicted nucleic acid-binding protein